MPPKTGSPVRYILVTSSSVVDELYSRLELWRVL